MTQSDPQSPVECLAHLLLRHARHDDTVLRRIPANDDSRHSLALLVQREPAEQQWARKQRPVTAAATMVALEELVTTAVISAHEAEDLSREAIRRARRGVTLAVALGLAALIVAMAGSVAPRRISEAGWQSATAAWQFGRVVTRAAEAGMRSTAARAAVHEARDITPAPGPDRAIPAAQSIEDAPRPSDRSA